MIKCNDCEKEISESATKCPQCGAETIMGKRKKHGVYALIAFGIGVISLIIYFYFFHVVMTNDQLVPGPDDKIGAFITRGLAIVMIIFGIINIIKSK